MNKLIVREGGLKVTEKWARLGFRISGWGKFDDKILLELQNQIEEIFLMIN